VVARDGIEPPTPAFSGPKSANVNYLKTNWLGGFFPLKNCSPVQPIATIGSFRIAPLEPVLQKVPPNGFFLARLGDFQWQGRNFQNSSDPK
jgi:hypothetical protein